MHDIDRIPNLNPKMEIANESIGNGFELIDYDIGDGHGTYKKLKFPDGTIYNESEYSSALYYHVFEGQDKPPIPTPEGLISLINAPVHAYQVVQYLMALEKYFPGHLEKGLIALEKRKRIETIEDIIGALAISLENGEEPNPEGHRWLDEEHWWFQQIPDRTGVISDYLIRSITKIFLTYAPRENQEGRKTSDLIPAGMGDIFSEEILVLGDERKRIFSQIRENPIKAIKEIIINLPMNNAGKKAPSMEPVFKKFGRDMSSEELLEILHANTNLGSFDSKPWAELIREYCRK